MEVSRDLETITRQERELILAHFDPEIAWQLGLRLRDLAVSRHHAVAIEVRRFGQQLFYSALAGAAPDNAEWIRRKGNTVQRFYRSSYAIGLDLQQRNSNLSERYSLSTSDYAADGGSFPLAVAAAGVIGSLSVSGLPERDDHELVVEALCAYCGRDYRELALLKAVLLKLILRQKKTTFFALNIPKERSRNMQKNTLFTFGLAVLPTERSRPYQGHTSSRRTRA